VVDDVDLGSATPRRHDGAAPRSPSKREEERALRRERVSSRFPARDRARSRARIGANAIS
jgi:hypothetical protein